MTTQDRMKKPARARSLEPAWITVDGPRVVANPHEYLRGKLGDDATIVIESTDRVQTVGMPSLRIDAETTLHAHGFAPSRKCQARVARTPQGWIGDSVCECDSPTAETREVLACDGHMMCLGERLDAGAFGTTYGEARIKAFTLPIDDGPTQVDIKFRNYYEQTASGRLTCIAHRVTGFVARKEK